MTYTDMFQYTAVDLNAFLNDGDFFVEEVMEQLDNSTTSLDVMRIMMGVHKAKEKAYKDSLIERDEDNEEEIDNVIDETDDTLDNSNESHFEDMTAEETNGEVKLTSSAEEEDSNLPDYFKAYLKDRAESQANNTESGTESEYISADDYYSNKQKQNQENTMRPDDNEPQYNAQGEIINGVVVKEQTKPKEEKQPKVEEDRGEPLYVVTKKGHSTSNSNVSSTTAQNGKVTGKGIAWLAYILFFIPLLFDKNNPFVRHHANEGLKLNIYDIIAVAFILVGMFVKTTNATFVIVLGAIQLVGWLLEVIITCTKIFMIFFSFAGVYVCAPLFSKSKLIKY